MSHSSHESPGSVSTMDNHSRSIPNFIHDTHDRI
jgi:hypothetical protein